MTVHDEPREGGVAPALRASRIKPDMKAGLVLLAFCALAFAGTFTFDSVPDDLIQGPGAATFPRLVIGVIAVLSALLIWRARSEPVEAVEPVHPMTLATIAAQIAFMVILPLVGMIGAMFVAIAGMSRLWGAPRWLPTLVIATVTVGLIYALFVKLFHIPIPLGLVEGLLG